MVNGVALTLLPPLRHYRHYAITAITPRLTLYIAIRNLDLGYSLYSFIRDLLKIREQTFKVQTVTHAFANSRI